MPYRKRLPDRSTTLMGRVYLIHFSRPFGHASHYAGFTTLAAEDRFAAHLRGEGSDFLKKVLAAGIELMLVRVWEGKSTGFEVYIKGRGKAKYCPICRQRQRDKLASRGPFTFPVPRLTFAEGEGTGPRGPVPEPSRGPGPGALEGRKEPGTCPGIRQNSDERREDESAGLENNGSQFPRQRVRSNVDRKVRTQKAEQ